MKYLLDTNICIYIIKNKPESVRAKLRTLEIGDVAISSISVSELMYGAYKSQHIEKNLKAIEHFLLPFDIPEYVTKESAEYGKLRTYLEKKGQVIGSMDMLIAAHALAGGFTLVTNNVKEFERVEGLVVENWVK